MKVENKLSLRTVQDDKEITLYVEESTPLKTAYKAVNAFAVHFFEMMEKAQLESAAKEKPLEVKEK